VPLPLSTSPRWPLGSASRHVTLYLASYRVQTKSAYQVLYYYVKSMHITS
jgi:hypothetical protein